HHELRGEVCLGVLRSVSGSRGKPAAIWRPPQLPDGHRECTGSIARGGARYRGRRRYRVGETGVAVSGYFMAGPRAVRKTDGGLPCERRVRDGEGGRREEML